MAGRASSGLRGRRTGAAIKLPDVELLGAWVRAGRSPADDADARAALDVTDRDATTGRLEDDCDGMGDRMDCADVGRSGITFAAAAARR